MTYATISEFDRFACEARYYDGDRCNRRAYYWATIHADDGSLTGLRVPVCQYHTDKIEGGNSSCVTS